MIKTPLGPIEIRCNDALVSYSHTCLKERTNTFCVDGRYGIVLGRVKAGTQLQIKIIFGKDAAPKVNVETGEQLFLVSFELAMTKVSIGTTGDIPNVKYQYLDVGLCLSTNAFIESLPIVVAWKHLTSENDGINTWLAADPEDMDGSSVSSQ